MKFGSSKHLKQDLVWQDNYWRTTVLLCSFYFLFSRICYFNMAKGGDVMKDFGNKGEQN